MIIRRFGTSVAAVEPRFEAAAFNELMFIRLPAFGKAWAEFQEEYERVGEVTLTAKSDGRVKLEVEEDLLAQLADRLAAADVALGPGEVLLIESTPGRDFPRMHDRTDTLVEEGRNVLHFHYWFDPPLRLGVYRPRT